MRVEEDTTEAEQIERLAKILHESGREAVEKRMIYRSDLPVKPFAEWEDLDDNTKEGRRLMARYVRDNWRDVIQCFPPEHLE
jgi:hypothetical protein